MWVGISSRDADGAGFTHSIHTFHLAVGLIHLLGDPQVGVVVIHQDTPCPNNLWTCFFGNTHTPDSLLQSTCS